MAPLRISRRQVKALHAEGKSDGEMAAELGCVRSTVRAVRLLLRLPAHEKRYRGWSAKEERELSRAIQDGEQYEEIGRRLGRTAAAVALKAAKLGLVDSPRGRQTPVEILSRAWHLFEAGCSTTRVAAEMGIHRKTAWRYRQRMPQDWVIRSEE